MSGVIALASLMAVAFLPAYASVGPYTMTLQTNAAQYSGSQSITITGTISPAPGPNTAAVITVTNPTGAGVDYQDDAVNPTTGAFSGVTVAGGSLSCGGNPCWVTGTYSVNATWGGDGSSTSQVVTFAYTAASTTSTTTTTTSVTTSTTTSTTSTTTTTSTTSTSTTIPAPEFPSAGLALVALVAVAIVAALSGRLSVRPAGRAGGAAR